MPAQNPNANRGEQVKPKPGKKVKAKVKPASPQRGTSPSGDRPQGREQAMDRTASHRAMPKDPNTGREISTLKTPAAPRGAQQRGTSPSGDRPQGRAAEMRAAPTHARVKKGHGPGTVLATISPTKLASKYAAAINWKDPRGAVTGGLDVVKRPALDTAELAVTTPSSLIKIGDTAIHHPKKLPGMLAEPYKEAIKDPRKAISEHPVSTALMFQPAVRVPGRVVGKVARTAGKQTLERPAKTLPGTALKEQQPGSRDAFVRAHQSRSDKKNPTPTMTAKEVQRRVDEFHDVAKQHAAHAEAQAVRETRRRVKGRPKQERHEVINQAREKARETVRHENEERFAREFGANVRLSTTAAERELTARVRKEAAAQHETAKVRATAAERAHTEAQAGVTAARARARSLRIATLERQRRDAQRDLAQAQRDHTNARVAHGVYKGRAEVLSRNIGGKAGGYGLELGRRGVADAATAIRDARARVRDLDQKIAVEHKRMVDVFGPEHQTLFDARRARTTARVDLQAARATAEQTRQAHIDTKEAMRDATVTQPTAVGRVFSHKADARGVMRKLNAQHGEDTFTLLNVGDGYAAVPKVAVERLAKHRAVGSGKATGAKVMRVSRQAFTQAVLPLSLKWLAGQGGEAGLRAVVAGAGPMDLLRMNKVVRKLNKERPGAGDELLMRVSGGQFGLTGTAREFAGGKSLAEEFADTGLERPARAITKAGQAPPIRAVRTGWQKYASTVFDTVNGAIENTARKAMAGQAIRQGHLMERHLLGLTDKAIEDAARGLKGSEAQVQLGRAVDRMYGKYQKFSPEKRSMLLHWTPFLPWYLNVATFLFKVLPVDHPVKTALIADVSMATEEWRKEHRLSLRGDHVSDFLLGSYPAGGNSYYRISKYTPFGVGADPLGASADLMLPQLLGPVKNAGGVDYKWQRLKHPGYAGKEFNLGERTVRAALTGAESQIPGVSQVARLSGVEPRLVDKKSAVPSFTGRLKKELPTSATKSASKKTGKTVGKVKLGGAGSSGGVRLNGAGSSSGVKLN